MRVSREVERGGRGGVLEGRIYGGVAFMARERKRGSIGGERMRERKENEWRWTFW